MPSRVARVARCAGLRWASMAWVRASWVWASSPEVDCEVVEREGTLGHGRVEHEQAEQPRAQQGHAQPGEDAVARVPDGGRDDPQWLRRGDPSGAGARDATLAVAVCWLIGDFPSWCSAWWVWPGWFGCARRHAGAPRRIGVAGLLSALASSAPRVSGRRYAACSGSSTGSPFGAAALGAGGEDPLGHPVLERVVGQDGDAAADGQGVDRVRQGGRPGRQLGVDLDAQRLEGALAGCPPLFCDAAGTTFSNMATTRPEVANGSASGSRPSPRRSAGEPLLAVLPQDRLELALVIGVEDLGGGEPGRLVHPHVQRRVLA